MEIVTWLIGSIAIVCWLEVKHQMSASNRRERLKEKAKWLIEKGKSIK